jgi:hypothetical protein
MPIDFSSAWKGGAKIVDEAISLLPNLILAVIVFLVFLILASAGRSLARRWVERRKKHQGIALLLAPTCPDDDPCCVFADCVFHCRHHSERVT